MDDGAIPARLVIAGKYDPFVCVLLMNQADVLTNFRVLAGSPFEKHRSLARASVSSKSV